MNQEKPAPGIARDAVSATSLQSPAGPRIPHQSYPTIFLRFLRFGVLAWGGPVAQIAMIKKELVEEEKWISIERFNRALSVYQVLPGPEAHELCVYFGMLARGRLGAILAGLGFMLPGFVLMFALSWTYVTFGIHSPVFAAAFVGLQAGVTAGVVGLIAATTAGLFRAGISSLPTIGIFAGALLVLFRWNSSAAVPVVILGAGVLGLAVFLP